MHRAIRNIIPLALAASTFAVGTASAQSVRYAPSIRRAAPPTPLPASAFAHHVFGRFSQPLFVGKIVLVTGGIDSRGTFLAETVTRITRIDNTTRADR